MNSVYKIALILLIGAVSCNRKEKNQLDVSKQPGFKIDGIKLTGLDNKPIDLKQYRGKTLFINFWATWCKPCLQEMPSIQKAQEILENENIVFLFASDEESDQIAAFKNENRYNFNYVKAGNMAELSIMALPTTFIFNPRGKLVFNEMGYRQWNDKNNIDLILNINKLK
jgi:thiol-disulfide isomerase/thioredoxin